MQIRDSAAACGGFRTPAAASRRVAS